MRVSACRSLRAHTPDARAIAADLRALPFRWGTFSQIYFLEAIEHLSEENGRSVLRELRRVSLPGARCLITTPNYRSSWVLLERLVDAMRLTPPMTNGTTCVSLPWPSIGGRRGIHRLEGRAPGSFNLVAPFLGMFSKRAGAWAVEREARRLGRAGMLLFLVCEAVALSV